LSRNAASQKYRVKAIVFDAYGTLFNTYSVREELEAAFPGHGDYLTQLWRLKQLEYSWLRALSGDYKHFGEVTRDALGYSLATLGVSISPEQLEELAQAYDSLHLFPDAIAALDSLADLRLSVFSNGSPSMLGALLSNAGIAGRFEEIISVDEVRTFKPSPHAYRLACTRLKLAHEEILLASSNGFDLHGGSLFGLRTARVDRLSAEKLRIQLSQPPIGPVKMFAALRSQLEFLSSEPDVSIPTLMDLREAIEALRPLRPNATP
jgi:2-haloacid dehalogenase